MRASNSGAEATWTFTNLLEMSGKCHTLTCTIIDVLVEATLQLTLDHLIDSSSIYFLNTKNNIGSKKMSLVFTPICTSVSSDAPMRTPIPLC